MFDIANVYGIHLPHLCKLQNENESHALIIHDIALSINNNYHRVHNIILLPLPLLATFALLHLWTYGTHNITTCVLCIACTAQEHTIGIQFLLYVIITVCM